MAEPFLGEVRIWGLDFAPKGWSFCDGRLMQINQNQALFSLIGTTFGGNGTTSFGLPNLQGRVPMHPGGSIRQQGTTGGTETVTLTQVEMPQHSHAVAAASATGGTNQPADHVFAGAEGATTYSGPSNLVQMAQGSVSDNGGGQAHTNLQPTLALTFTIALQGIYPSRS